MVLAGINLLGALSNPGGGIAYIAHLGGGVFGYIYLKNERLRYIFSKYSISNLKDAYRKKQDLVQRKKIEDMDKQVDRILEKISAAGMESLTEKERSILDKKSKMSK